MTAAFLISNAILGAAVLAFCVLIVRTILRGSPASIRHLTLAAGFATTLALPFGALLLQSAPLRLPPGVTQTVKTLVSVRRKVLDQQDDCSAYSEPIGEAEAGNAGEQPAEE